MTPEKKYSIRLARQDDKPGVLELAVATGLFQPDELEQVDGMLSEYFDGHLDDHHWFVAEGPEIVGAAYCAPEMMADRTWNLYFIGVRPERQGEGCGSALLARVEATLKERGQRLLLVETSGTDGYKAARQFYRKNGYDEEARIRAFYRAGDDKIVFRKLL